MGVIQQRHPAVDRRLVVRQRAHGDGAEADHLRIHVQRRQRRRPERAAGQRFRRLTRHIEDLRQPVMPRPERRDLLGHAIAGLSPDLAHVARAHERFQQAHDRRRRQTRLLREVLHRHHRHTVHQFEHLQGALD